MGAYNFSSGYWVVQDKAPYQAKFVTSNAEDFDRDDATLRGRFRGRGIGDCFSGIDEEARFLAHMHRSRLEQDNDQLLLGVFDDEHGTVLDQLHVRLQSLHTRCAELLSLQHWHPHVDAALRALCPFLFEDVGVHRSCCPLRDRCL